MKYILDVESIFYLKNRGSVLNGNVSKDRLQDEFLNLTGAKVYFHSSDKEFVLKVLDIEIKQPCFGYMANPEIIYVNILVDRFIDNSLRGKLFKMES